MEGELSWLDYAATKSVFNVILGNFADSRNQMDDLAS